jgi:sulfide:quinone oxidoreductase
MKRTLILGGGFGGLTVAHELAQRLGAAHEVIVIDREPEFLMGLRKPWAIAGHANLDDGRRARARIERAGLRFIEADITQIEPAARRAQTGSGSFDGDYLVVALGAESRADLVAGLTEHGHDMYDPRSIPALARAVAGFKSGTIHIAIAGGPYKCPPAPFETAMLLDEHLRERGLREQTQLSVSTFQPLLMPNAGRAGSAWVGEQLDARRIEWQTGRKVARVEAGRVVFENGEVTFDLLIGVPPHRPPEIVKRSGLCGEGAWIPVDPATLRTSHENVFAIGDATQITLANGLPLPKAGLFAELEGQQVAAAIVAAVRGEPGPPPFDGRGYCFIEMGASEAGLVQGEFFATPEPSVTIGDISAAHSTDKHRFESERLERWFGG